MDAPRRRVLFALALAPLSAVPACGSTAPPAACATTARSQDVLRSAALSLRQAITAPPQARIEVSPLARSCDLIDIPAGAQLSITAERYHIPRPVMNVLVNVNEGRRLKTQVFLQFSVQAWVRSLIVTRSIHRGELFDLGDCAEQEVDVATHGQTLVLTATSGPRWLSLRDLDAGSPLAPHLVIPVT
ncbi:hypothetical protein [Ideonella sp.]|uniref:hypothetical protein n=1 Tax=Ideonella sp. TaxID=1929293 RepID=UPI0035B321E2